MLYYYEYETKEGKIISGHNLMNFKISKDVIELKRVNIQVVDDCVMTEYRWEYIDMKDTKYFKIVPEVLTLKEVE